MDCPLVPSTSCSSGPGWSQLRYQQGCTLPDTLPYPTKAKTSKSKVPLGHETHTVRSAAPMGLAQSTQAGHGVRWACHRLEMKGVAQGNKGDVHFCKVDGRYPTFQSHQGKHRSCARTCACNACKQGICYDKTTC